MTPAPMLQEPPFLTLLTSEEIAKSGNLTTPSRSRLGKRFAGNAVFLSRARKQAVLLTSH